MAASNDPRDHSDLARQAGRIAREAARMARTEAREEARRFKAEAVRVRRQARDEAREARAAYREQVREEDSGPGASIDRQLDLAGVREVVVNQTAGRLIIRPCHEGESPRVETAAAKSPPELDVRRDGDRLIIEVRLTLGRIFRRRRGAETTVTLTPGFDRLSVDMGHGHLYLESIACGSIKVEVGAGETNLRDCTAAADIDVGAGQVLVAGHRGLVRCDAGTGDIRVDIAEASDGEYSIDVGMGQAELMLPAGAQVHTVVHSGIGKSEITYPDAGEGAPTIATVNAGVGRAAILQRRDTASQSARPTPGGESSRSRASRRSEPEEVRVLQLLEQGRITSREAAELIAALQGVAPPPDDGEDDPV